MSFASSRQTLIANIAQQGSAVAALLVLPNVLTAPDFSETVFVAVVMSFIALADLGLSFVYSRIVPAMSGAGEDATIARWDRTIYSFGGLTSFLFAVGISTSYFLKFGSVLHTLLLFPLAPLNFLASFLVTRASCLGDFLSYRRMLIARSLLAIGVLPITFFWGITGWFVGTLMAALLLLMYSREDNIPFVHAIDWSLVRQNIGEGVLRCGITVLWLQLLNVGRLYATAYYSHENLANYGIAASAYQALASVVTAVFIPVGIETLRRYGRGADDAMQYVYGVGEKIAPWVLLGTIIVAEISQPLLRIAFPTYRLDPVMLASLLSGVVFYPFFIMWGNCLIGARRFISYMLLILVGLAAAWMGAAYFGEDVRGAAIGQFIGLMVYSLSMYLVIPKVLAISFRLWLRAVLVYILTVGSVGLYWLVRW